MSTVRDRKCRRLLEALVLKRKGSEAQICGLLSVDSVEGKLFLYIHLGPNVRLIIALGTTPFLQPPRVLKYSTALNFRNCLGYDWKFERWTW